MKKIVLGFDGSEESHDALRLAKTLAAAREAEVIVVVNYPYPLLPVTVVERDRTLVAGAASLFDQAERELEGVPMSTRTVGASSPARALHDVAQGEEADLIVIGSTHRGSLGRVFPGSVGERLLNGAPCAVAVAPRGFARGEHFGLGLIGVGYDGTAESRLAVLAGARLAARLDVPLRLISVMPKAQGNHGLAGYQPPSREELESRLQDARALVAEALEGNAPVPEVETALLDGDPAAALADQGVELDLLVVGSRGYGPLRHTMLGGVSAEVIRTSPCPVLVVPRAAAHGKS